MGNASKLRLWVGLTLVLFAGACGGGGSSSTGTSGSPPSPPVSPPPPPAPTPPPSSNLYPPAAVFGLVADVQFSVIGWMGDGTGEMIPTNASDLSFGWSASVGTYEARLPGYPLARLQYSFPGNNSIAFDLVSDGVKLDRTMSIIPKRESTGLAYWGPRADRPRGALPFGNFAFGIPPAPADIPTTGRHVYSICHTNEGAGELVFDRQAGMLTGFVDVAYSDAWGPYSPTRYALTPTPITPGSVSFSASFQVTGAPSAGVIEGYFAGPQGHELILRLKAPVKEPYEGSWQTSYESCVGRQ